jgi:hydroxyacylglutathione hydrolase
MIRYIYILLAFCAVVGMQSVRAQEVVLKNDDLTISKLEDNMWVVETFDNTTMYIIEGNQKSMLIDTGTRARKLDEVIRKITGKPLVVVLTHAHGDHAGNIHFFDEVWLHAADTVLLRKDYKGTVRFMDEGHIFDLGGTRIEVVHTPAHTPGSVIFLDWDKGNCYSGDAIGSGSVWLHLKPSSPMRTYINTCKKIEALMDKGISKIYCGHYPYVKSTFDKSYVTAMRQLAESIDNGPASGAQPSQHKIPGFSGDNPMVVSKGEINIVYEPAFVK